MRDTRIGAIGKDAGPCNLCHDTRQTVSAHASFECPHREGMSDPGNLKDCILIGTETGLAVGSDVEFRRPVLETWPQNTGAHLLAAVGVRPGHCPGAYPVPGCAQTAKPVARGGDLYATL